MYTLTIFITLSVLQYIFFLVKRKEVREYRELVSNMNSSLNLDKIKTVKRGVILFSNLAVFLKKFLYVGIGFLIFINFILSLILGTILHFILSFI